MSAVHKHFTQQQLFVALYLTKQTRGPLDRLRKDPTALQRSAGHREDFRISFLYLISTPKGKPMRGLHRSGNTMPRLSFPGSRQAAGLTASSSAFGLVVTEPLAPARHCDGESGLEAVEPKTNMPSVIAAAPKMPRSRGLRL